MNLSFTPFAEKMYETVFNQYGVTAMFTPENGDAFPLKVIIKQDEQFQPGGKINYAQTRYIIAYRRSDIDRKVKKNETFTIDGTVFTVFGMSTYPDSWSAFRGEALVIPS